MQDTLKILLDHCTLATIACILFADTVVLASYLFYFAPVGAMQV